MIPQTFSAFSILKQAIALVRMNALVMIGVPFLINLGILMVGSILGLIIARAQVWMDFLLPPVVAGLMTMIAMDLLAGRRPEVATAWTRVTSRIGPLILLSLAATIASVFGLALLIVPGLYISAVMLPLVAVIMLEDRGWQSARHCFELTKPIAWPLIGLILLLGVLGLIAMGPLLWFTSWTILNNASAPTILLSGLLLAVSSALTSVVTAVGLLVYLQISGRNADVAEVFE